MHKPVQIVVLGLSALGLMVADFSPQSSFVPGFVPEAAALIGRPVSPMSFAGVARRTTRRAVYADTAAVAATSAAVATTAAVESAPPSAGGSVAIGTVITTLPPGCSAHTIDGVQYKKCNGTYYRAAFQGSNLVYVAAQP